MVEVAQNDQQATIFGPKHVLGRDLDIVEGNIARAGRRRVRGLDGLGLDALAARNKEDGEAALGLASDSEIAENDILGLRQARR